MRKRTSQPNKQSFVFVQYLQIDGPAFLLRFLHTSVARILFNRLQIKDVIDQQLAKTCCLIICDTFGFFENFCTKCETFEENFVRYRQFTDCFFKHVVLYIPTCES